EVDRVYEPDVAVRAVSRRPLASTAGTAVLERAEVQTIEVTVPVEDIEIEETFLTIKELPGRNLVTVIEALSPTNKKTKRARREYLKNRRDLIRSRVNFIKIDLLRGGKPMPLVDPLPPNDYRILICRARPVRREIAHIFTWRTPIPAIPIPLLPEDAEPAVELNSILHSLMDRARYDLAIDYSRPPRPRLRRGGEVWGGASLAPGAEQATQYPTAGEGHAR